jgi:hypothetical protein
MLDRNRRYFLLGKSVWLDRKMRKLGSRRSAAEGLAGNIRRRRSTAEGKRVDA